LIADEKDGINVIVEKKQVNDVHTMIGMKQNKQFNELVTKNHILTVKEMNVILEKELMNSFHCKKMPYVIKVENIPVAISKDDKDAKHSNMARVQQETFRN
jgi:hypothetical protein